MGFSRRKIPRSSAYTISDKAIRFRHPYYDPDRAQKLISSSMSRDLSTRNISNPNPCTGFWVILLTDRQTNKYGQKRAPPPMSEVNKTRDCWGSNGVCSGKVHSVNKYLPCMHVSISTCVSVPVHVQVQVLKSVKWLYWHRFRSRRAWRCKRAVRRSVNRRRPRRRRTSDRKSRAAARIWSSPAPARPALCHVTRRHRDVTAVMTRTRTWWIESRVPATVNVDKFGSQCSFLLKQAARLRWTRQILLVYP